MLTGSGSIPIRELWETIIWTVDNIPEQQLVLKGDAQDALPLFMRPTIIAHHPLLPDTHILSSYFHEVCVLHR